MRRHVIVISEDAMVFEDIEYLKNLPNFGSIWNKAARVEHVRSIYPTITYPCHTTMMTGVYPETHGIVNNEKNIPGEVNSKWVHFRRDVHAKTVFDYAHEAGRSTAAVFWPVTGGDQAIDHLINEYWPQHGEDTLQCFREAGTDEEILRDIIAPRTNGFTHRTHPFADAFVHSCAAEIIRKYKPDLLMLHPANVDAYRHHYGVFSPRVNDSLHDIDLWLGDILKATEDAGIRDNTDFFIVSDHGQLNISRVLALNCLLAEAGFITVNADGSMGDYVAYAKSAALSAHIYMKDPADEAAKARVYAFLCGLRDQEVYGVQRVYTAKEVQAEEHLANGISFVVESDGYTTFSNDWRRPLVRSMNNDDYKYGRGTHGHHPDKGPQPTLIAFGPDIKPGAVLSNARLVDEAPTFAHALGLTMEHTDGRVLEELFNG